MLQSKTHQSPDVMHVAALQWKRSWSEDTVGDNWEDTAFISRPSGRRPKRKVDPIRGPRDAYLRPMIDTIGIRQRLAFKQQASGHVQGCKIYIIAGFTPLTCCTTEDNSVVLQGEHRCTE
jgi:hypothetical protein